eukprot:TRINITY_DN10107_c0_g1_i1.p1 TRINITY_DN10107_c0_g1~~TRINITY_DN10107_c0_g1_i1.p1  ORF type:complete len:628 (+),score=112.24 TRINITY_DN10107_c0_g1_i1:160-2043(+)
MKAVIDVSLSFFKALFKWNTPIHYKPYEHFCMRLILVALVYSSFASSGCKGVDSELLSLRPNGIARFVDVSWICSPFVRLFWNPVFLLASIFYVIKYFTYPSLAVITIMDLLFFTMKNSKGWIGHSNQISSIVLLTQFSYYTFVYVRNYIIQWKGCPEWLTELLIPYEDWIADGATSVLPTSSPSSEGADGSNGKSQKETLTIEDMAVFYAQQAIAATYVMAALSKYQKSTGNWLAEAQNIVVQVVKANQMEFFNRLKPGLQQNAFSGFILGFCVQFPLAAQLVFGGGLYFEFFAFFALFNRIWLLLGGFVLWMLHEGILIMMRLDFYKNQRILVAYYMNIPYWTVQFLIMVTNALASYPHLNVTWKNANNKLRSILIVITSENPSFRGVTLIHQQSNQGTLSATKRRSLQLSRNHRPVDVWVRRGRVVWHKIPWKFMVLLLIICYNIQEFYPFSHFPMYASNNEETELLFVTDYEDHALPFLTYFATRTTSLKKYYRYNRGLCLNQGGHTPDECTLITGNQTLSHFYQLSQVAQDQRAAIVKSFLPLKLWLRVVQLWPNSTITTADYLIARYPSSAVSISLSAATPVETKLFSLGKMMTDAAPGQKVIANITLPSTEPIPPEPQPE